MAGAVPVPGDYHRGKRCRKEYQEAHKLHGVASDLLLGYGACLRSGTLFQQRQLWNVCARVFLRRLYLLHPKRAALVVDELDENGELNQK